MNIIVSRREMMKSGSMVIIGTLAGGLELGLPNEAQAFFPTELPTTEQIQAYCKVAQQLVKTICDVPGHFLKGMVSSLIPSNFGPRQPNPSAAKDLVFHANCGDPFSAARTLFVDAKLRNESGLLHHTETASATAEKVPADVRLALSRSEMQLMTSAFRKKESVVRPTDIRKPLSVPEEEIISHFSRKDIQKKVGDMLTLSLAKRLLKEYDPKYMRPIARASEATANALTADHIGVGFENRNGKEPYSVFLPLDGDATLAVFHLDAVFKGYV